MVFAPYSCLTVRSWADDHDIQFGLRGGETMTVADMLQVHPDIIQWIATLPLLDEQDRSIAQEIMNPTTTLNPLPNPSPRRGSLRRYSGRS